MAQVLEFIGIPDSAIIQEPDSLNTHQNAVNVKEILNARGIHRVLLVTSAIHMPRALLVFKHEGIDALPAPAGAEGRFVEHQIEVDAHQAHQMLGALEITAHPVEIVGYAREHQSVPSTIHVSLLPPPWEELTTREPSRNATRVSPPVVT